jgi:hypothetical protein
MTDAYTDEATRARQAQRANQAKRERNKELVKHLDDIYGCAQEHFHSVCMAMPMELKEVYNEIRERLVGNETKSKKD